MATENKSCVCDKNHGKFLGKLIFRNGAENYLWACKECLRPLKSGVYISKNAANRYIHLADAPIIDDHRELNEDTLCSYKGCKSKNIEYHHWAPKEIFGKREADHWPVSPLCTKHHSLWHAAMYDGFYNISEHSSKEDITRALSFLQNPPIP